MKVNNEKIVTPIIKPSAEGVTKKLREFREDLVEVFNDKGILGQAKVLLDSGKEIANEELTKIKTDLENKMIDRGFSQNNIDYLLGHINKDNYEVAQLFVDDPYAHTSKIMWAVPYTTRDNAHLMKEAALRKNYGAIYDIKSGKIENISQIEDLREKVISEGRTYNPIKKTTLIVNQEQLAKDKQDVLEKIEALGVDFRGYESSINEESIEVAKVLLDDKQVDKKKIIWILPNTNSENAELMLQAVLNKDYNAVYSIYSGNTRLFETLEARYAALKRLSKVTNQKEKTRLEAYLSCGDRYENPVINDNNSKVLKLLFENPEYDLNMIDKIFKHINKDNAETLAKALMEKDFATIEKIIGEKFNPRDIDFMREGAKFEFKITSSNGKITRNDFVSYLDKKLACTSDFNVSTLKDSEVRNLVKLFGTTEEQIRNMSKKEYRRLCIQTHPDRNPHDNMADKIFRILNRIYLGQ